MKTNILKTGFSLVEVCVGLAIFVIGLVPVFRIMTTGSVGTVKNRNEIIAQQYVANIIAFCNVKPFNDPFLNETEEKSIESAKLILGGSGEAIEIDIEDEGFKKICKKTIEIKNFNPSLPWPYKYKIITVKVKWQQPGEHNMRVVSATGLVSSDI